jgi:hypothetical protein
MVSDIAELRRSMKEVRDTTYTGALNGTKLPDTAFKDGSIGIDKLKVDPPRNGLNGAWASQACPVTTTASATWAAVITLNLGFQLTHAGILLAVFSVGGYGSGGTRPVAGYRLNIDRGSVYLPAATGHLSMLEAGVHDEITGVGGSPMSEGRHEITSLEWNASGGTAAMDGNDFFNVAVGLMSV